MNNIKQSIRNTYFLGSGAATIAGCPTFGNFREKIKEKTHIMQMQGLPDFNIYDKVLRYWEKEYDNYNIEELFSIIDMHKILGIDDEIITTEKIFMVICDTVKYCTDVHMHFNGKLSYSSFYDNIFKTDDAVITTNWDIGLETHSVGGDSFLNQGMINYGPVINKTSNPTKLSNDKKFRILKLHGSLNWGNCEKCGRIYYFDENQYFRLSEAYTSSPQKSFVCSDCKEGLKGFIIPPIFSKLNKTDMIERGDNLEWDNIEGWKSSEHRLNSIWKKAHWFISNSKEICFTGYSFPETDVQLKYFVSDALDRNNGLENIIIVTDNKHGNAKTAFEDRYRLIIPKKIRDSNIYFNYDGFQGFCENIGSHRKDPFESIGKICKSIK